VDERVKIALNNLVETSKGERLEVFNDGSIGFYVDKGRFGRFYRLAKYDSSNEEVEVSVYNDSNERMACNKWSRDGFLAAFLPGATDSQIAF